MSSKGVAVRGKKSSWFNGIITNKYPEYSGRQIRLKHFHFLMLFILLCISDSGNAHIRRSKLVSHSNPIKKLFCVFSYFDIFIHVVEV